VGRGALCISIHRENRVAMCEDTLNISIHREKIRVAMWQGALYISKHRGKRVAMWVGVLYISIHVQSGNVGGCALHFYTCTEWQCGWVCPTFLYMYIEKKK
jgi:hypothetical protein